ncbi:hypothetical protein BU17DRAFT_67546 [Hysterangium stoloniferum]|nr:hypothetical protein BU17DRAFT_67546 [Hysterangium stoloniferum]
MSAMIEPSSSSHTVQSLQSIQRCLYDALTDDSKWVDLLQQLTIADNPSHSDKEGMCSRNIVAKQVEIVASCTLDIEANTSHLRSDFFLAMCREELENAMPMPTTTGQKTDMASSTQHLRGIAKPSLQSPRHPTSTPIASALAPILPTRNGSTMSISESARSASDPNPLPEFIEHAYKFFVANIFNPYPTRDEKQAIVDKTNNTCVTVTTITNWFTNARRRCGWADILKRRCNGNRDEMIDLAKRVFVRPDPRNPVDSRIVTEFMEMKESVESMYDRKTRTSAWIEDLDALDELVNPIPEEDRLAARKRETEDEREARRREKDMLKEQREFERQKRKMQAEALRKADKVTKRMQREEQEQEKQSKKQRTSSLSSLFDVVEEEEEVPERPNLVAGGKRKDFHEDGGFDGIRNVSPSSSLSSFSFMSDSSDNRVPSLSWSDSGDDERPYKRTKYVHLHLQRNSDAYITSTTRSSSNIPETLAPDLDIPTSFSHDFNFDQPMGLTNTTPYNLIFDFSMNPTQTIVAGPSTPSRGQKRPHDTDESVPTPHSKRAKPIVLHTSTPSEVIPAVPMPSSLFTPTHSTDATPTLLGRRRSSFIPLDIDTVLGLNNSNPEPVQMALPDTSIPLEVGVYDWSSTGMAPFEMSSVVDAEPPADFSQLLQMFQQQQQCSQVVDSQIPSLGQQEQEQQLQLDLSNYSFSSLWPQQSNTPAVEMPETHSVDLSGLMTGLMSAEAFNDMGFEYQESVPCTPEELSRSPSGSPAWEASVLATLPLEQTATTAELTEKALMKEKKRKELEEKKAALERERALIAEMERELADD